MIHQATLSFNGGELSDYLVYRNDFGKHAASAARMRNFLPMPFGGVAKRPGMEPVIAPDRLVISGTLLPAGTVLIEAGTEYGWPIYTASGLHDYSYQPLCCRLGAQWIIDGEGGAGWRSAEDSAATPDLATGWTAEGTAIGDPVVTLLAGEPLVNCDRNSLAYPFTASDGTQYLLHFTPGVLKIYRKDGSTAATLDFLPGYTWPAFSWERSIRSMQIASLNDVLFLCHPDFYPLRLSSTADTEWLLEFLPFDRAPMLDENLDPLKTISVAGHPIAAAWVTATVYAVGDKSYTGTEWICYVAHTADSTNQPGVGSAWRVFWRRRFYLPGDPVTLTGYLVGSTAPAWAVLYVYYNGGAYRTAPAGYSDPAGVCGYYAIRSHTTAAGYASGFGAYVTDTWADPTLGKNWFRIKTYSAVRNYVVGELATGALGITLHRCRVVNGPGSSVHGPTDPYYWDNLGPLASYATAALEVFGAYGVGSLVSKSGVEYECIAYHRSNPATTEPGVGSDWEDYWKTNAVFDLEVLADSRSPGVEYRLAPERDLTDMQIMIPLLTAYDQAFSSAIAVDGGWNVFTYGDWHGTLRVYRSFDKGMTWEILQTYTSSADNDVAGSGQENVAALLRLGFAKDGITPASGTMRAVLIPESLSVTGYVQATGLNAAGEVTGVVKAALISGRARVWARGAFNAADGFPQAVTLHERRLIFAATTGNPVSLWFSKIDDYMNFQTSALDDGALFITLASGSESPVRWLASARRLFIGTALGEWVAGSETDDLPMTFGNIQIRQYATRGSCHHRPLLTQDGVYFLGRNASRLYELAASPGQGPASFGVEDHSRLAEHLTAPGVSSLSFQQTREPCLWAVTRAGHLLSFHHSRDEQQSAWAMHTTAGGEIFDCVVFPSDTGDDEVFFVTQRGAAVHLERFAQGWQTVQEAGTVGTYTDGVDEEPIVSELRFLPVDLALQGGTTHGRRKRANEVLLSVFQSYGGGIRYDGELQNFEWQTGSSVMDTAPPLETGWVSVTLSPGYVVDLQPAIIHSAPYPFTVRAAVLRWEIHEP